VRGSNDVNKYMVLADLAQSLAALPMKLLYPPSRASYSLGGEWGPYAPAPTTGLGVETLVQAGIGAAETRTDANSR
jgi:hypothetical protein